MHELGACLMRSDVHVFHLDAGASVRMMALLGDRNNMSLQSSDVCTNALGSVNSAKRALVFKNVAQTSHYPSNMPDGLHDFQETRVFLRVVLKV